MTELTNSSILQIAMHQSAIDLNCSLEDFLKQENVVVESKQHPDARKYLTLPFECNLVSYGNNIVASVSEKYRKVVTDYISRFPVEHCFETPNMHVLNDAMQKENLRVCFMAEYFLPDLTMLKALDCPYELRILGPEDFTSLYTEQWSNALCEKRKELDVLGVAAFDGEKMIGFAGCSADCETMWQIGVDVLPEYRRQGIASAVTSRLALEILKRGKVPFYCAAWSNLRSVRNAIRSGFRPTWVEMTVKSADMVNEMNGQTAINETEEKQKLIEFWLSEEEIAHMKGWDFSHIHDRYEEEDDLPWDYKTIIQQYLTPESRILDIDTGGGEFLLSLNHPYEKISATEAWPPNIQLCQETLLPLGIDFRAADGKGPLPFDDHTFDLVINRHGDFCPEEIYRVLKPGGVFITQQVGAENDRELVELLLGSGTELPFPEQYLKLAQTKFESVGFQMLDGQETFSAIRFYDVGALVWFARIIEWEFPGFSVEGCRERLFQAQELLQKNGVLEGRTHRFLLVAEKQKDR